MNRLLKYSLVFIPAALHLWNGPVLSQTINPYNRIVDPFAIARLDEPDFAPLKMASGWIDPQYGKYPLDSSYWIYAQDTGSGIITHLFVTSRNPDSQTSYRLYVDNVLVRQDDMQAFFDTSYKYFQSPLDTIIGEARLCDVQIPYRHGFQLMTKLLLYNWYDYCWRPLPSSVPILSGSQTSSSQLLAEEQSADSVYRNPALLWRGTTASDKNYSSVVQARSNTTLLTIEGSNIVRTFKIRPASYDTTLDSLWLNIYWDGESTPSFSTSLLSLFGQSYDFRDLHSLAMDFSQDSGFTMHLPMPFAHSMRVELSNRSSKADTVSGTVSLIAKSVDPAVYGSLHTYSSISNPTKFEVDHPLLHIKGTGKYVGTLMGIHDIQIVGTMEGDAIFRVDSIPQFTVDYEGTEDYFNGAAYFSYGNFFTPFAGTSNSYANFFRFHYLDPIDFRSSLDVDMQHGLSDDSHEYYRTLAFWYQRQIPFWVDRDTIRPGEVWHISGGGYQPNEEIDIFLDSIRFSQPKAGPDGTFNLTCIVPNLRSKYYTLSVNGISSPYKIFLNNNPTIRLLDEPKPLSLKVGDTIHFSSEGFIPGDSLTATIGGKNATTRASVVAERETSGWFIVPDLADNTYTVSVSGSQSGAAIPPDQIHVTRTLRFECEDLWTPQSSCVGTSKFLPLLEYLPNDFSDDAILWFRPDSNCHQVNTTFFLPYSDTFSVEFRYGRGRLFGDYDILFDSVMIAHIQGYDSMRYRSDSLWFGTGYYPSGNHSISFRYTGRDSRGTDSVFWADFIKFNPIDLFFDSGIPVPVRDTNEDMILYPNPATSDLSIVAPNSGEPGAVIIITDLLGRELIRESSATLLDGTVHCSLAGLDRGIYFVRLQQGGTVLTKPFSIVR